MSLAFLPMLGVLAFCLFLIAFAFGKDSQKKKIEAENQDARRVRTEAARDDELHDIRAGVGRLSNRIDHADAQRLELLLKLDTQRVEFFQLIAALRCDIEKLKAGK